MTANYSQKFVIIMVKTSRTITTTTSSIVAIKGNRSIVATIYGQSQQSNHYRKENYNGKPDYSKVKCQFFDEMGHTAKRCPRLKSVPKVAPTAKWISSSNINNNTPNKNQNWMLDTGASYHIIADLLNLSLYSEYEGPDDVVLGDGSGLPITHLGTTQLPSPSHMFSLHNVLCIPSMKRNLISISQFCKTNNVSLEFIPSCFFVKDLSTGATLLQGPNKDNTYEWPTTLHGTSSHKLVAFMRVKLSPYTWHRLLGHLSFRVLELLFKQESLPSDAINFSLKSCFLFLQ